MSIYGQHSNNRISYLVESHTKYFLSVAFFWLIETKKYY